MGHLDSYLGPSSTKFRQALLLREKHVNLLYDDDGSNREKRKIINNFLPYIYFFRICIYELNECSCHIDHIITDTSVYF